MIKRKKLSQEFLEYMLEWLKSQELPSGTKIPSEGELAIKFSVSRTTVREGIKYLAAIGVLEIRRGIGTFILNPQPGPLRYYNGDNFQAPDNMLNDLLEFRLIVEPETAALAALRRKTSDLKELFRCVEELDKAVVLGMTTKIPEDLGFHIALARASGNSALMDTSSMIARFYEDDPYPAYQDDVIEHRAIYNAVEASDQAKSREMMRFHLDHQKKKYQEEGL
jgi:DNA-binding FadR family transcriptional regulator